ncbi:MAG: hypothetical protein J6Y45_04385 [Bacteroidales bacterium]|nr:hypothetical protein [Bacteroidales bacterium]
MKNYSLLILLLLVAVVSCSKQEVERCSTLQEVSTETKSSLSQHDLIYNSSINVWMVRQDDPYKLSNIKSVASNKAKDVNASATHYALKLYPRNEKELDSIIQMENVPVSYIPFGYAYAHLDANSVTPPLHDTLNEVYIEEERYFIDNGDSLGRHPLPVLYLTWEKSKPLPVDYDYTVEYEACLPSCVETDAINDGVMVANTLKGSSFRSLSGYIRDYDDLLGQYIPVSNLKVKISYGLSSLEAYTNSYGYFLITGNINDNANVQFIYENSQWRISDNSLLSLVETQGTVNQLWANSSLKLFYLNNIPLSLHRAAHYFFNGNHGISTPPSSYSLRINMLSNGEAGSFTAALLSSPWIDIKVASYYNETDYCKHVLHELGHFNHYQTNGGFIGYATVHKLIKESYADFVSWHMSWGYYKELNNGVIGDYWDLYLTSPNQLWQKTQTSDLGCNSPIFIDLVDNLNQKTVYGSQYNNDMISGVSVSSMPSIIEGKTTWSQLRSTLMTILSSNYSSYAISEFVDPYDYYINNLN